MKIGIKPIIGGATGNRTPISGETVRYNSRYTIAPNASYGAGSGENLLAPNLFAYTYFAFYLC